MSFYVAEGWASTYYRWSDPDVFATCDNPECDRPWVTGSGLIAWALHDAIPLATLFTDRLLIACDRACLAAAQRATRDRACWDGRVTPSWSAPASIARWLDALRDSLSRDPASTPIGEIVPVGA